MTETRFPAELARLTARDLTREQVVADMNLIVSQFPSTAAAIDALYEVPVSTFFNCRSGAQGFTNGLLFALYGENGNELRVMGPHGRYIRRDDPPIEAAVEGDDTPPPASTADQDAAALGHAGQAATATAEVDAVPPAPSAPPTDAADAAPAVAAPSTALAVIADTTLEPARAVIRERIDALERDAAALADKAARLREALAILDDAA